MLNGNQYTVAGVLRPDFRLNSEAMPAEGPMDKADVFLPLPLGPMRPTARRRELQRDGASEAGRFGTAGAGGY